jgi:hypothetical protein
MKLPVSGPTSWTPPPGLYHGTVEYAGPYGEKGQIRIVVALEHDDGSGREYKVHHFYSPEIKPGNDLYRDIEALMGRGYLSNMCEFDLDTLRGIYCGVTVTHIRSNKFKKPLVTYDNIYRIKRDEHFVESESQFPIPLCERAGYSGPLERNLQKLQQQITELDRRNNERP